MAEHDCTWARLIEMETDAARLRVTPVIVGRTTAGRYDRRRFRLTRITIYVKMVLLANQ
jgi:hypothetical protein